FNGTLRREVLNAEWFTTTKHAQIVINHWLTQYNHTRPHQALNMHPPAPETISDKPRIRGTDQGGWTTLSDMFEINTASISSMEEKGRSQNFITFS
ncbi:MAG: integrase core domain-containing protein, partial [Pseudomonadota bacterium]